MPRKAKGARLWLREREGRKPVYIILDGGKQHPTGTDDLREAEGILAEHISQKKRRSGPASADDMTVADALVIYGEEHAPTVADPVRIGYAISALLPFWGKLSVASVKGETCRRYGKQRKVGQGTIRKELGTLQAALRYCAAEGYLLQAPTVTLPPRPETTQRALTRTEAAKLLRIAKSQAPHVARFILISLYTGSRRDSILGMRLSGPSTSGGWFDLDAGVLYRIGQEERGTKKRRTPVRMPRKLLTHARRWHQKGNTWAVQWRGQRVASIKTAWRSVVTEAKLGWNPTPHTLKHTAITWAIESGMGMNDAAKSFGTSSETIERVYWDRSPHFQSEAARIMDRAK